MSILFIFQQIMQIYYLLFKMHVMSKMYRVHERKKEYYKNSIPEKVCSQECWRTYRELFQVSVLCKMIMWTLWIMELVTMFLCFFPWLLECSEPNLWSALTKYTGLSGTCFAYQPPPWLHLIFSAHVFPPYWFLHLKKSSMK